MAFPVPDRYSELVKSIVSGSFYGSEGIVIPFRSDPTEIRIETGSASTDYGVYVNEIFAGQLTTDVNGNAIIFQQFPKGEIELILLSNATGRKLVTYLTVRDYALWLTAYAENLEVIDDNIIQARNNISIETADVETLESHYGGGSLGFYQNIGQSLEVYRTQISELRSTYRMFGGRAKGMEEAAGAICQVPPFIYTRKNWGPNWTLAQDMLVNNRFLNRSAQITRTTSTVTGVTITNVEPDVISGPGAPHSLTYDVTTDTLYTMQQGAISAAVDAHEGEVFIPGSYSSRKGFVLGRSVAVSTYGIAVGVNDTLYLNLDSRGTIAIVLSTGLPAPTPANVVTDINAALFADARYGAPYVAAASVYNSKLLIESQSSLNGTIKVEHGTHNAATDIFGVYPNDLTFAPTGHLDGVTLKSIIGIDGSFPLTSLGCQIEHEYNSVTLVHRMRWKSPTGTLALSAWTSITETGDYTLTDNLANTLTLHVWYDDLSTATVSPATTTATFAVGYSRYLDTQRLARGVWVDVDRSLLPAITSTDQFVIYDDATNLEAEIPDYYRIDPRNAPVTMAVTFLPSDIVTGKVDPLDPVPATKLRITDATINDFEFIGHIERFPKGYPLSRGRNSPYVLPGQLYDYEGFEAVFSGWFKNFTAVATTVDLSFSYDGGDTWVSGGATAIVSDPGGSDYENATYVSFTSVISPDIVDTISTALNDYGVLVKVALDSGVGTIDVSLDGLSVIVKNISSRDLQSATVARSRHSQYFGELVYLWSPEELTIAEKVYLGITHKLATPISHYGGVTITTISTDTPAGSGTLEYEFNPVGSKVRMRWTPNGTTWALGFGWVGIISDGSYTLLGPGGSYIVIDVTFANLPVFTGVSVITRSRAVVISDETVDQGLIRRAASAHSDVDIIDLTEYDSALGSPVNLKGAITEADFALCGLVNCDVQSADPIKYSYVFPEFESQEGETCTLALVGADYTYTLEYYSDEDQTAATLYEEGLPVPNDLWSFSLANEIAIPQTSFSGFGGTLDLAKTFTIDYDLLYQVTTSVIDLGLSYQDYAWWADYYLWDRYDKSLDAYETTTPVYFNIENGRAYLQRRSTMDRNASTLFVQKAGEQKIISTRYWRYIDDRTISIDLSLLESGQYYLTHEENRVYPESRLTVTFEHRSAATSVALLSATYSEISRNEAINVTQAAPERYHQLRLSVAGIRDLSDFRIRSLTMKGMHLFGASASVPGITNLWK